MIWPWHGKMKCKTWIKELQGKVKVKIYHVDRWFELKVFFYERNKFVVSRMKIKFAWRMVRNGSLLANETISRVKILERWRMKIENFKMYSSKEGLENEEWERHCLNEIQLEDKESSFFRIRWRFLGCVKQLIPWAVWRPLCSHDGHTAIDSLGCVKAPV